MRCIFCKQASDTNRTIEHIIPESLGNKEYVLPVGVVCDKCNWYFGTKVEKELLAQTFFTHLRHRQHVLTKKGKPVSWEMYSLFAMVKPEHFSVKSNGASKRFLSKVFPAGGRYYVPYIEAPPADNLIISRFLAKVAIEVLASRVLHSPDFQQEIIDNPALDPLRRYGRYGDGQYWPYSQRKIYHEEKMWSEKGSEDFQLMHEYNIVSFQPNEYYLVLAIFGIEFCINYSNRNVHSFSEWLASNNNKSPLAYEKFPTPYAL